MSGEAIRQAVILVGGKGTRLGAITSAVPKPMLPIAGDRPFLDYLLEMIERHGYRDIVLLAGHLGEAVEAAYGGRRIGKATVRVMREPVPLGTAGALTIARDALDPRFLLMNGDAFFDINLRALERISRRSGATATLALRKVADAARYGRVIEEGGKVKAFLEKDASRPGPGVINGGIYVLKREILDLVRDLPCSLEQHVFPALAERGEIAGHEFDGYFLDIGLPETSRTGTSGIAQCAGASRGVLRPGRARRRFRGGWRSLAGRGDRGDPGAQRPRLLCLRPWRRRLWARRGNRGPPGP